MAAVGAAPAQALSKSWVLADDFKVADGAENPSSDSYGNAGTWSYMHRLHDQDAVPTNPSEFELLSDGTCVPVLNFQLWTQGGCGTVSIGVNKTGVDQQTSTSATLGDGRVGMYPLSNDWTVVGWKSPIAGNVRMVGWVGAADTEPGHARRWAVLNAASDQATTSTTLYSGEVENGTVDPDYIFTPEASPVSVEPGEMIYLLVGPGAGNDWTYISTKVHLFIYEAGLTTTITSGPGDPTNDSTPTFEFEASEAGSTFRCVLIDAESNETVVDPCVSPYTSAPLSDGPWTFEVYATSPGDEEDTLGDYATFTVDTSAPDTAVVLGTQSGVTHLPGEFGEHFNADPLFALSFAGGGGESFECATSPVSDPAPEFAPCSASHEAGTLSDGAYVFEARASDEAGNTDLSPARYEFARDTSGPVLGKPKPGESSENKVKVHTSCLDLTSCKVKIALYGGKLNDPVSDRPLYGSSTISISDDTSGGVDLTQRIALKKAGRAKLKKGELEVTAVVSATDAFGSTAVSKQKNIGWIR